MHKIIIIILSLFIVLVGLYSLSVYADSVWKRDPFQRVFVNDGSVAQKGLKKINCSKKYKLDGILSGLGNTSQAFINGDVFSIGEKVGKYTLIKVQKDHIRLESRTYQCVLKHLIL